MKEEEILIVVGVIALFIAFSYLIKTFVINTNIAHKLLEEESGFSEIKEISLSVNKLKDKLVSNEHTTTKTVKKDNLYLLDIKKYGRSGSNSRKINFITLLIKENDTGLKSFFIRRKMSDFLENLIRGKQFSFKTGNKNFDKFFVVYSENGSPVKVPDLLIQKLLFSKEEGPFSGKHKFYNSILVITPKGYAISSDRVLKKDDLRKLVKKYGDLEFI